MPRDMIRDLAELSKKRALDFLILLMPYKVAGKKQRRIALYSSSCEVVAAINESLLQYPSLAAILRLERAHGADFQQLAFYSSEQFLSRKELQPKIQEISESELVVRAVSKKESERA
jgi:hypothetical protein